MNTVLLDPGAWDLLLDASGNIAMASNPYSQAQDAASAIKTFQGEVYYDDTLGIPYWTRILGRLPPLSYIKAQLVAAALTVPGVTAAACFLTSFTGRVVTGQVQIVTDDGANVVAGF